MRTGTISIRSGTWKWIFVEINDLPEWTVSYRRLSFQDPDDNHAEMSLSAPLDWEDFSDTGVARLALDVTERRFDASTGELWRAYPLKDLESWKGSVRRVHFRGPGQQSKAVTLPPNRTLGDLTHSELLYLLEDH